ncbi:hypothetical protein QCA50_017317 [Cerrena zonata]|uniref:DUF6593 domain-containing protein n=1 Tax=Cerrena zonata TaxID=2478898 RepID=A0AAW0FQL1_9APHY
MPQRTDSGRALFIPHHELKMLPDSIHKTFIFSKDSFINTSLVAEGSGDPGYEIRSTVTPRSTKTRVIRNATDVVTLTKREWPRSNTLAFSGCSEMKMKNWLRDGSFTALQSISDPSPTRYVWKTDAELGELTLVRADTPDSTAPLAIFRFAVHGRRSPTLHLTHEAEYFEDAIVASLLVIAHGIRIKTERQANRMAPDALRMQPTTFGS